MIAAISQRVVKTEKGDRDAIEQSYVRFYEKFGLLLVPIPNVSKKLQKYSEKIKISRLILTGGDDITPKLYGSKGKGNYSIKRDMTEINLIKMAIKRKIPILATCRGMQMLNIFFKGKIEHDIKEKTGKNHVATRHKVIITGNAQGFFGKGSFVVNSYHNHGVTHATLSNQLRPFAISEDSIIEGIYHPSLPIAGITWHPERKGSDSKMDSKLVRAFVERKLFWSIH